MRVLTLALARLHRLQAILAILARPLGFSTREDCDEGSLPAAGLASFRGRDMLGSAMDVHLSMANNRMAGVTTRLTLVATIFLPLNFVAGFFGMNLDILPRAVAIPLVLASMVALPAGMFMLFKRHRLL